jgi:hypothetical protein
VLASDEHVSPWPNSGTCIKLVSCDFLGTHLDASNSSTGSFSGKPVNIFVRRHDSQNRKH